MEIIVYSVIVARVDKAQVGAMRANAEGELVGFC